MSESPVFVAVFGDRKRTTTRMTVWHADGRKTLDLGRGIRLAQAAGRTRLRKEPPAIIEARFERDGVTLQEYDAGQIKAAIKKPAP
jgi:hypothetical protein